MLPLVDRDEFNMKPASLSLDRLEFTKIHVVANPKFDPSSEEANCAYPQLNFNFSGVNFVRRTRVNFPDDEAADPRHFQVVFSMTALEKDQEKKTLPYEFDVEVIAYLTYLGSEMHGVDRFKAVRYSAYPMLYGAIREMVSTTSARSSHGMLQLPSADFRKSALSDAEKDEERRLALLGPNATTPVQVTDSVSSEKKVAVKKPRKKLSGDKSGS